jgi:hypothetical protein
LSLEFLPPVHFLPVCYLVLTFKTGLFHRRCTHHLESTVQFLASAATLSMMLLGADVAHIAVTPTAMV